MEIDSKYQNEDGTFKTMQQIMGWTDEEVDLVVDDWVNGTNESEWELEITEITANDLFEITGHFDEGCQHCGCTHCRLASGERPHCCNCCCDHRE